MELFLFKLVLVAHGFPALAGMGMTVGALRAFARERSYQFDSDDRAALPRELSAEPQAYLLVPAEPDLAHAPAAPAPPLRLHALPLPS
jgi:hypothetical protein